MSCGIYSLVFAEEKVYVGKSVNIERRFLQHLSDLKNNTSNYKLQKAYKHYGPPSLYILEECSEVSLNDKEIEYIKLLETVEKGLNISAGGEYFISGLLNPNSKYSQEDIEKLFHYIVDNSSTSIIDVSKKFNIPYNTVFDIASCNSHLWLKSKYPDKYKLLENIKNSRTSKNGKNCKTAKSLGIKYPLVIDPNGFEHSVENVSKFIRDHSLSDKFYNLLKRRVTTYKGWTVKEEK